MSFDPIRLVRPEVRALTAYHAGPPPAAGAVKLDANESPFALGELLRGALADELAQALADVALHRYPDAEGRELRQLLAKDLGVTPDCLLLANGSDEAIQMLVMAVAGPGRAVLAPVPTFVVYELSARMQGLRFIGVPLGAGFLLDEAAIRAALARERPQLVFLAWPNNPTGRLYEEAAVARILQACAGELCDALVVVDEAYVAYSGRSFLPRLASHPNLVVFRTLSKIGLAGIRLGMIVASPALIGEINKVRMPYNVNALSQAAAQVVLRHADVVRRQAALVVAERERLSAALRAMPGIEVTPSDANFFLLRTDRSGDEVARGLLARGILVRDFSTAPYLAGCLRITVGAPSENDLLLSALADILGRGEATS